MSAHLDGRNGHGESAVYLGMPRDDLEAFAPAVDLELDPGIRRYVLILRQAGIETFESCQGGVGHAFPDPTIKFHGNNWEGFKAISVAMTYGLPVLSIRLAWAINDGMPQGPWWEMTFRTMDRSARD
jgi:hypothetical protein